MLVRIDGETNNGGVHIRITLTAERIGTDPTRHEGEKYYRYMGE